MVLSEHAFPLYSPQKRVIVVAKDKTDLISAAYGWDADISDEEVLRRLLELNQKRAVVTLVRPKKTQQAETGPKKYQRSFIFRYKGGKEKVGEGTAVHVIASKSKEKVKFNQQSKPTVEDLHRTGAV